jgi:predicted O-methyltransferase YrrM
MSEELWMDVDRFIDEHLVGPDPILERALRESAAAGLPAIAVSPAQGKMLHLLARIHGARRILELGTLGAYSTIWMARALPPGGRMITLELNPDFARTARANIEHAGFADVVEVRVGPALAGLEGLVAEAGEPFDLIFIDADKQTTPDYFRLALELSRPGGVIVVDNVIRDGALIDAATEDRGAIGMRAFHEILASEPGVSATSIQTVGSKGYDGFTLVLVGERAPDGADG